MQGLSDIGIMSQMSKEMYHAGLLGLKERRKTKKVRKEKCYLLLHNKSLHDLVAQNNTCVLSHTVPVGQKAR